MSWEEKQDDLVSIRGALESALDALELAGCCETESDFIANINDVIGFAKEAIVESRSVLCSEG